MSITPKTVDELLDYWPGNIPFKGQLVSNDGCMCAQGQVLHFLDNTPAEELRDMAQTHADKRVAELLGISRAHSVLLRIVNDQSEGAPTCVVRNPEKVLGDQAPVVLAFWWHLDQMPQATREAAGEAARQAAGAPAGAAARQAAGAAAGAPARAAAWAAAYAAAGEDAWAAASAAASAAAGASNEIQGAAVMRAKNQPFFFLPLFGFADPEAVMAADKERLRGAS